MDIAWVKAEYSIPQVDFLNIDEVYAIKGVRQLEKKSKLPPPDMDLSTVIRKGECCTSHHYWLRGTIVSWLLRSAPKSSAVSTKV